MQEIDLLYSTGSTARLNVIVNPEGVRGGYHKAVGHGGNHVLQGQAYCQKQGHDRRKDAAQRHAQV